MQTAQVGSPSASRRPLAPLGRLTAAITFGIAALLTYDVARQEAPDPFLISFIVLGLIAAGLIAAR